MDKQWTTHNLNDKIEFKLTKIGAKFVENLNNDHPAYQKYKLTFTEAGSLYTMTLWEFASIFGPTFGNGFDQTVETNFRLIKQ